MNENLRHQIVVSGREFEKEQDNMKKIEALNDVCHLKIKEMLYNIRHMTDNQFNDEDEFDQQMQTLKQD